MKRLIKAILKIVYKSLRGIYRILPIPRSAKNRIRNLAGRAAVRFQKSLNYENPDVVRRCSDLENAVQQRDHVIYEYEKFAKSIFQTGEKDESFVDYADNDISFGDGDVKTVAYYLPQFHTFPENDKWWGRGFTEWTNVTKAFPRFNGHYQPHLPIDMGFYDLTNTDVMKRQIELAKNYGIYGFCFHYYWFGGKRLLEKPLENFLSMGNDLDFPFCLCWANENWTRRWDGAEENVLLAQKHSDEDSLACITDICRFFTDDRYIKVDGKPLIIIYRADIIPNIQGMLKIWRTHCSNSGIGDIHIIGAETFGLRNLSELGFDGGVEFPPHFGNVAQMNDRVNRLGSDYLGLVYDIEEFVDNKKYLIDRDDKTYKGIFPSWDNTPRRGSIGNIFQSNPDHYKKWLNGLFCDTIKRFKTGNRFIFINAWNEWGEGAHLEQDRKYGYAYLQATADVVSRYASKPLISVIVPAYNHENYIESSLRSIASQTYPCIELVIIDDCSSDSTVEIIERLISDADFSKRFLNIKLIKHNNNKGASSSINEGIKASGGRYVSVINTDDSYEKNRLAEMYIAVSGRRMAIAFSAFNTIDNNGKHIEYKNLDTIRDIHEQMANGKNQKEKAMIFNSAILDNNLSISTGNMFFTRHLFDKLGGFGEYSYIHDWDFILRATLVCQPVFVPETRYLYRIHDNNSFIKLEYNEQQKKNQVINVIRDVCTMVAGDKHENKVINETLYRDRLKSINMYEKMDIV